APDGIFVKPMPLLTLDYFLPREVHANDPLTSVVESPEPFTLGVRVRNNGQGTARNVSIDSAQPRIVENTQGLAIGFEILDSQVNDRPVAPTLLLGFGDIPPQASTVGRWSMVTSLSGKFVDFQAAFSHADELGGALTSLLEAANTHWLIRDVLVDLPGRDGVRDFLAEDGADLRVHESSGDDFPVADHSAQSVLTYLGQHGAEHHYTLETAATPGFLYLRLPDPGQGGLAIRDVIRSDGKRLREPNAWRSRTRNQTMEWDYAINLFDAQSTGRYTLILTAVADVPQPPVIAFLPDRVTHERGQLSFLVEASDPHGGEITLSSPGLPGNAAFVDQGTGTGVFTWHPRDGDAGVYDVTFMAANAHLESARTATITVNPWWDPDGEGLEPPEDDDSNTDDEDEQEPEEPVAGIHGQSGLAEVAADWRVLTLHHAFEAPVLLLGAPSEGAIGPGVVEARRRADGHFDIRLVEWNAEVASEGVETLPYLVLEAGHYHLLDGSRWEVGVIELPADGAWHNVEFSAPFETPPTLLLSPQSADDGQAPMAARSAATDAQSFSAALLGTVENEGEPANRHIAYLAIAQSQAAGSLVLDDVSRAYAVKTVELIEAHTEVGQTHLRLDLPFEPETPVVEQAHVLTLDSGSFATLATADATWPAGVRRGNPGGDTGDGDTGDGDTGDGDTGDGDAGDGDAGDGDAGDGDTGDGDAGDGDTGDGDTGDGDSSDDPNAPQVEVPADIFVDAVGRLTPVFLGQAQAWSSSGEPLEVVPDRTAIFTPGRHGVIWRAVDADGNVGFSTQYVHVRPLANFGVDQWVAQGSTVTVTVYLNGVAPAYPVELAYTVDGGANYPLEHNAVSGVLVLEDGETEGRITFDVHALGDTGAPDRAVRFRLTEAANAAVGAWNTHHVWITEHGLPPVVRLEASQQLDANGQPIATRKVLRDGGLVTVRVEPGTAEAHAYDWTGTANVLINQPDDDPGTFVFDPAGLGSGYYRVVVDVTTTAPPLLDSRQTLLLQVLGHCPYAATGPCTDLGDSQGDGLADYLRREATPAGTVATADGQWLGTMPGLRIRQGWTASAAGHASATVQRSDLAGKKYGRAAPAPQSGPHLAGYQQVGSIYDFEVTGMSKVGASVAVTIPLLDSVAVTQSARYLVFHEGIGWRDFVEDTANRLHSSSRDAAGECPLAGDPRYRPGLVAGARCLQLTLQDGGPNDTGGDANGLIRSTGALYVRTGGPGRR
ncbi:MAG: hypothetical protein WED00_13325, partial [Aquisalimonadaceae bacterium]